MRIECVIECHSSASKSPWHDYVIHELKTKKKKSKQKKTKRRLQDRMLLTPFLRQTISTVKIRD